jgi:hypothetical protein
VFSVFVAETVGAGDDQHEHEHDHDREERLAVFAQTRIAPWPRVRARRRVHGTRRARSSARPSPISRPGKKSLTFARRLARLQATSSWCRPRFDPRLEHPPRRRLGGVAHGLDSRAARGGLRWHLQWPGWGPRTDTLLLCAYKGVARLAKWRNTRIFSPTRLRRIRVMMKRGTEFDCMAQNRRFSLHFCQAGPAFSELVRP